MPESPRTDPAPVRSSRTRIWCFALAGLVVLALALWVTVGRGGGASESPVATPAAASTPPPFPSAPYAVTDETALTVPEESRFASGTFWAQADTEYIVTMDLRSTKPAGSGGRSMYLGVTLSCAPRVGGPGISIGGTQNMLTGEQTAYRNQGLISVPEDGGVDCSIKLSAPYDDVASTGTTFPVDATWRVRRVDTAAEAPTAEVLPRTLAAGATTDVLTVDLPIREASDDLRVRSSLHLTTCTGVNGSREDGKAWCSKGALDDAGSTVTLGSRIELVGEGGTVCDQLGSETIPAEHIDLYRHHRLLSLDLGASLPGQACGQTLRVTVSVRNDGPAPLVVHSSNSSLVVTG